MHRKHNSLLESEVKMTWSMRTMSRTKLKANTNILKKKVTVTMTPKTMKVMTL